MQSRNIGTVSSVITFSSSLLGVIGSAATFPFSTGYIELLGVLIGVGALASAAAWLYLLRSQLAIKGIQT
jgi:hypothetical protein